MHSSVLHCNIELFAVLLAVYVYVFDSGVQ